MVDLEKKYLENIGTESEIQRDFMNQINNRFVTKKITIKATKKQIKAFVSKNGIEFSRDLFINTEIVGTVFVFIKKNDNTIILNLEVDNFLLPEKIDLSKTSFDIMGDLSVRMMIGRLDDK